MRSLAAWLIVALLATAAVPGLAQEAAPRKYLSIDYKEFSTFGAAVKNSLAPTDIRANAGAVLRNTVDPLNPGRYLAAVVLVEAQRQLASGQGLDLGKIVSGLSPTGLACGYFGGQAGELMGAGVQSILANCLGPLGGLVGFASRPVLWYLGSTMGQDMGKDLKNGKVSPSKAMGHALREFNPVLDSSQMIGDALGSVVGQALIPIPLIGCLIGGAIGGTIGLLAGKAAVGSGAGKALDESLRRRLRNLAGNVEPAGTQVGGPPGQVPRSPATVAESGPAAPSDSRRKSAVPDSKPAAAATPETRRAGDAAYKRLMEALKSGDQKRIRAAHEAIKQPAGAN